MTQPPDYEVYAIKYAEAPTKPRQMYVFEDPHEGPDHLFFFIWLIRGGGRTILVDCGFDHERGKARGRELERLPVEGLAPLGVAAADIDTVILTHMHYDHAGTIGDFPNAEFIIQDEEVRFATGRYMRYPVARKPFEADDVSQLIRENFAGRVRFIDGEGEIAPGINVHPAAGHSRGLQAVSVTTRRGLVILASDAAHFYGNIKLDNPYPIVADIPDYFESLERLLRMAPSRDHLIPGHDPLVAKFYPTVAGDAGIFDLAAEPSGTW